MLNEKFLSRLREAFPEFYERVDREAAQDAMDLKAAAHGDVQQALVRARMQGAGRVWVPYVRGALPVVGNERPAMEAFSKLVLTVDHVVGYSPPTMEAARDQVVNVLRNSLDVERLRRLVDRDTKKAAATGAATATAATGIMASATALMSPITAYRQASRWIRYVPVPVRVGVGAVVAAAVLSVPLVAGYSAGIQAEKAARQESAIPTTARPGGSNGSHADRTSESRSFQTTMR